MENVEDAISMYQNMYGEMIASSFRQQIEEGQDMIARTNYQGHITATAYICSLDGKQCLFVYNKNLQKYLPPG